MGEYDVIDSVWFGVIGIVRVRPEYGDDKFYIGTGIGDNKYNDEQAIAMHGMPFYPEHLERFFDSNKYLFDTSE